MPKRKPKLTPPARGGPYSSWLPWPPPPGQGWLVLKELIEINNCFVWFWRQFHDRMIGWNAMIHADSEENALGMR